jgi:hypothetical protein
LLSGSSEPGYFRSRRPCRLGAEDLPARTLETLNTSAA